jgi:ribA/ribD-fused uncharacterized protein
MLDRNRMWSAKAKLKGVNGGNIYMGEDYSRETEKRRATLLPILKLARSITTYETGSYLAGDRLVINKKKYSVENMEDLPADLNPRLTSTVVVGDTTYFYTKHAPFSNHYPASFKMGSSVYCCSEQAYFAAKAEYWGDFDQLQVIMKQKDGGQSLTEGKKIKNMTGKNWEDVEFESMKKVNREKFKQNPTLRAILLGTTTPKIAEASPRCQRWGIGFPLNGPQKEQHMLWGDNKMGKVLVFLRSEFQEEPQDPMQ